MKTAGERTPSAHSALEREAARIKRLLARAGRGRMVPRRLPADLGGCRFPASLEGGAKFLRLDPHRFDPVLTQFAASTVTEGAVVWDIGANVGLFTFAAAGLAGPTGRVVAVEPDLWLVTNLRRAASWNPSAARVDVVPVAIADRIGVSEFIIAGNNRAVSFLTDAIGSPVAGGVRERHLVPTFTLDRLAETLPMPDVLKVDVEGAEDLVLAGADRVLQRRPKILIETSDRTSAAVHRVLSARGYGYVDAFTGRPVELPVFNTLAVHRG